MSDTRAMGHVGPLRYEVMGRPLVKADLRRIVFHLLTVCEDFDPSDFAKVVDAWGPTAEPAPVAEHEGAEEGPDANASWLEGWAKASATLLERLEAYLEERFPGIPDGSPVLDVERWVANERAKLGGGS